MSVATHSIKTERGNDSFDRFVTDVSELASSSGGVKDIFETICNICDWRIYLNWDKGLAKTVSETFGQLGQVISFVDLFGHMGALKDQFRFSGIKDPDKLREDTLNHLTLGIANAADTALLMHETGLYVFKEMLRSIQTIFWTAIGIFGAFSMVCNFGKIRDLTADLAQHRELYDLIRANINLTYLQITQSAVLVSMAAISLISLVFAGLAQGLLFTPPVMLGLSSFWLILNFATYFYDRILVQRQDQLAGMGHALCPSLEARG